MRHNAQLNATVVAKKVLSDYATLLRIRPDQPIPEFKAGQYAVLGLPIITQNPAAPGGQEPPHPLLKSYSIASAPRQRDELEFYVARVPSGDLSPELYHLRPGDRVHVGPRIAGTFTLDKVPADQNLLFVASGSGLGPFVSMIREHYSPETARHWIVVHGVRYAQDFGFHEELEELGAKAKNFHYLPTVSRTDPGWSGLKGRVTDILASGVIEEKTGLKLEPDRFHALLCGNPDMIRDVTEILEDRGFRKYESTTGGNIHREEYW